MFELFATFDHSLLKEVFKSEPMWQYHSAPASRGYSINKTDTTVELVIDVPGVSREDIDVSVEGDSLKITASRKSSCREYVYSYFLGDSYDTSAIDAKLENGVLTISIPRSVKTSKKIVIK